MGRRRLDAISTVCGENRRCAFADWATWPNTLHANRLLLLAEEHGLGSKLKDIIFRMCYEEGENVSLRSTVARAAEEAGIPGGAEHAMSDDGMEELQRALNSACVNGNRVSGVPYYSVMDGALAFSGAQPTGQWVKVLNAAAQDLSASVEDTDGC